MGGDAAHVLHTIKGVAATLGATLLSLTAANGETALKNNCAPDILSSLLQELERLFGEACHVFRDVAEELDSLSAESESGTKMDRETLIAGLIELETLLSTGNMRAIQQYQVIRGGLTDAERALVNHLDDAMQRLDFSAAAEWCRKIGEEFV